MANILRILCFYLVMSNFLHAKDFGVFGHTFRIEEESLLEYLRNRLANMTNEDVVLLNEKIKQKYLKLAEKPPSITLEESKSYRIFFWDPSITVAHDILDHEGKIIVAQGSTVNPLKICPISSQLLFIDGDNPAHIDWAKTQDRQAKWVLVNGKPLELEEKENRAIYFDQFGYLTQKFGIKKVPAKVSQSKDSFKIQIEEIPV